MSISNIVMTIGVLGVPFNVCVGPGDTYEVWYGQGMAMLCARVMQH